MFFVQIILLNHLLNIHFHCLYYNELLFEVETSKAKNKFNNFNIIFTKIFFALFEQNIIIE